MPGRQHASITAQADEEASFRLLDDWLRIENEHTDTGFVVPGRGEVVAWAERHPLAVLCAGSAAVWAPVLGAICLG